MEKDYIMEKKLATSQVKNVSYNLRMRGSYRVHFPNNQKLRSFKKLSGLMKKCPA